METREFIVGGETFTIEVPVRRTAVEAVREGGPAIREDGALDFDEYEKRYMAAIHEDIGEHLVGDGPERWQKLQPQPDYKIHNVWHWLTQGGNRESRRDFRMKGPKLPKRMSIPKGKR